MVSLNYDSDSSDGKSFHSFDDNEPNPPHNPSTTPTPFDDSSRFPPEEEAALLAESHSIKSSGNTLFATASYSSAIQTYDRALASCPNYLDYEIAVLRSNIAACHLKLQEWKEAIESAGKGLECLERIEPLPRSKRQNATEGRGVEEGEGEAVVEEVDETTAERIERLRESGHTLDEIRKLQIKLLLRRGKARTSIDPPTWSSLQGADEDYALLLHPSFTPSMTSTDRRSTLEAQRTLRPQLEEAKQREMAEMMDKLKGLGNTILKPFGLSTSNFQFVKDEGSGGYSVNFNQNPGKK